MQLEAVTLSLNQGQGCKNIMLYVLIIKCDSRGQEDSKSFMSGCPVPQQQFYRTLFLQSFRLLSEWVQLVVSVGLGSKHICVTGA